MIVGFNVGLTGEITQSCFCGIYDINAAPLNESFFYDYQNTFA